MVLGTGCIPLLACDHSGIVPWKRFYFQLIFLYEKKCGCLNILGKVSHPRRVCLPNLLKCSLPLRFLFILAHKYQVKLFPLSWAQCFRRKLMFSLAKEFQNPREEDLDKENDAILQERPPRFSASCSKLKKKSQLRRTMWCQCCRSYPILDNMITASLKVNPCAVNISSYYMNFLILNPSRRDETAFLKHFTRPVIIVEVS